MNKQGEQQRDINMDKKALNIKNKAIDQEYQKYVFEYVAERTPTKVQGGDGNTYKLVQENKKNISIDLKEGSDEMNVYKKQVAKRIHKIDEKLQDTELGETEKKVLRSLKDSLEHLKNIKIDNVHIVFDQDDFYYEHIIEIKLENQILLFRTPFIHIIKATMMSDKEQLQSKIIQITKQLYFSSEQFGFMISKFYNGFEIHNSIYHKRIKFYATVVSGNQFRDSKEVIESPGHIFNKLSVYQHKKILECFEFYNLMDGINFAGDKDNLSDLLKDRSNLSINHLTLFNPYSQSEIAQSLHRFENKMDNSLKKIDDEISGVKIEISGIKNEISGIKNEISGIKSEISGIKNEISNLKSEISGSKTEISNLKDEISNLKTSQEEGFKNLFDLINNRDSKDNDYSKNAETLSTNLEENKLLPTNETDQILEMKEEKSIQDKEPKPSE